MAAADRHPRRPGAVRKRAAASRVRRSCPTSRPPSPRRPTAARPTCSTSARASSSPTARTLKPSDFVRTFERQFTVPGPTSFYSGIDRRGQSAAPRAATCRKGVVADDSAYTLTHQPDRAGPRADGPARAAVRATWCRVTRRSKLTGNNVPPGTGPYMWKSYNPNTRPCWSATRTSSVWSHGRPAGRATRTRSSRSTGCQVSDEVTRGPERPGRRGRSTATSDPVRPAQPAEQRQVRQPGARERADGRLVLRAEHQDARRSTTCKARQAINFAADRDGLRQDRRRFLAGRADLPDPAAQLPRPTSRYCPYTAGPDHTTWTGPDYGQRPSSWCSSPARPG